jgi:phage protein D
MASTNLAPYFQILINGSTELTAGHYGLIQSLTVEASADGADELVIRALAKDPGGKPGASWKFLGENVLAPGNLVTVQAGYMDGDPPVMLQRFRIHAEAATYPSSGTPEVEIRGYSPEAALGAYTRPRAWKGPIADSVIVQEIAEAHGLTVTADSLEATAERTGGRVKAKGTSDLVFLAQLAVANGYGSPIVRYDPDTDTDVLYFRPQVVDESKALALVYNPAEDGGTMTAGNLLAFAPELDLHGVPTRVEITGWDPAAQVPIVVVMELGADGQDPTVLTGEATAAAGYKITSGSQMQARALTDAQDPAGERVESVPVPSVTTTEEAKAWATRWIKLRNTAFLAARGTTVGIPSLWCGQVHRISGVAPTHAGLWEVLRVAHRFGSSGYTCDLDFARVLDESAEPTEGSP